MIRITILKKSFWVLIAIALLYLSFNGIPYFIATYQYEKLLSERPVGKENVEEILFFYSARKINIYDSLWAKGDKIKPGESIWQYLILWMEPIDIIYDKNLEVVEIMPSFE